MALRSRIAKTVVALVLISVLTFTFKRLCAAWDVHPAA